MPPRAFKMHNWDRPHGPVILSVPHAGRDYAEFEVQLRVPLAVVRPLEDRYADRLVDRAVAQGAPSIVANAPRLIIDLNRAPEDLDPAMVRGKSGSGAPLSARARGGLGLIPARLGGSGSLWRKPLEPEDVEARLSGIYRPFHAMLAAQLMATRDRHGAALLIDLHSMPPLEGPDAPEIVIGDRFGRSASASVTEAAVAYFEGAGLRAACNAPYAGGHIATRHASPAANIHALQIELDRRLYLDDAFDRPGTGIHHMQALIADLVATLAVELTGRFAAAAE